MKDAIDSVWGSVKDRFTNPFLGTFLFVWLVRNWYLVYGLFIFDKECTMDDKLNYVKNHFKDYDVFKEFFINTGWAILLLFTIYLILLGVQFLMRVYKLLVSKINAYFDKIPVESKEHYLLLNKNHKSLNERYRNLSASNDVTITELENLENTIIEQTISINSLKLSCSYLYEQFLITYPYNTINKYNKNDIIKLFKDIFRSVNKNIKGKDLIDVIINVLNYLNTTDNNVLVYFEAQYLSYLSLQNSVNHEELTKFRNKYEVLDTKVANFSEDILFRMDMLSLVLNLSGVNPNEEVTD